MFFLSIPIPDFIPSDRSVKTFVDFIGFSPARKNKRFCFSLAYSKNSLTGGTPHCAKKLYVTFPSDTTDRTFGKPNRTLVPAPMVLRHKTLHLTAELTGKENTTRNLQQQEAGPSGLFPERISFLKSRPICNSVITLVGGDRDWRPLELWRVSSYFF